MAKEAPQDKVEVVVDEAKLEQDLAEIVAQGDEVDSPAPAESEAAPVVEDTTNEYEAKALESGWKPQSEWTGAPDEWVDAKEYVGRAPLFKALHSAKRELKQLREGQAQFNNWRERIEKKAREDALTELRAKYAEATEDRDVGAAIEIKDRIKELEAPVQQPQVQEEVPEEFTNWVQDNPWYNTDPELRKKATRIGYALHEADPTMEPAEIFEEVSRTIKERHKDHPAFAPARTARKTAVDTTSRVPAKTPTAPNRKGNVTMDQIPPEARTEGQKMIRAGYVTSKEFIDGYIALGGKLVGEQ
jgi:hypothetical protein